MTAAAIIVAAGRGSRAAAFNDTVPKQYRQLAGESVLARAVQPFNVHPLISEIIVVIHPDDEALATRALAPFGAKVRMVTGGTTRQQSVNAGLQALLGAPPRFVLIHDAARPFVSSALIEHLLDGLATHPALLPGVAVTDTLKHAEGGKVIATVDRTALYVAQTPQAFHFAVISAAHGRAADAGKTDFTDDVALVEWSGGTVRIVTGDASNIKLTTAQDFQLAELRMRQWGDTTMETRTGHGFDVHAFTHGDAVMLCGVSIAHDRALAGHSDADVGLHALTDAVLGALCDGDIGAHFPPSDPQWKGASSDRFLADAARRVAARQGRILHADVTLLCETPKIDPHRDAMRCRVADVLGITVARVSVKATTTEGLGFVGRREGIAAQATATIMLPVTHNDI